MSSWREVREVVHDTNEVCGITTNTTSESSITFLLDLAWQGTMIIPWFFEQVPYEQLLFEKAQRREHWIKEVPRIHGLHNPYYQGTSFLA